MCGICGIIDLERKQGIDDLSMSIVKRMTNKLLHRGPDDINYYRGKDLGLGFSRLSIIDLEGGIQPIFNEDESVVMICNGEIFNYIELRRELIARGHVFTTKTDVEVIIHLYEEEGIELLHRLNGQFAFVIYNLKTRDFYCARDHFGIVPFYYTILDHFLVFGSEIKAILEYPGIKKEVDLVGLDQVLSFPGLISPRTMFKDIKSLENGHYLAGKGINHIEDVEYWDLIYPGINQSEYDEETFFIEKLKELIRESVRIRLRSDVPVGIYISGGLDSSLISVLTRELTPGIRRFSFSIDFEEKDRSEANYQRIIAKHINSFHSEKMFLYADISERLKKAVYHSESPLRETYNTASLALSEAAREKNIKVVLSGEGADEWFAGYPGYKFDKFRILKKKNQPAETSPEDEINRKIWGEANLRFEVDQYAFREIKKELYSPGINEIFDEIDCLNYKIVNRSRLSGRHILHQRSYLDFKLRLAAHLLADHGDRMTYANSVEGRYPFLDRNLVDFAVKIPPSLKLNDFNEKYILKKIANPLIPQEIIKREKFAFHAPGSPYLLNRNINYINDILSYDTIKRQGYFNPDTIEKLKKQYRDKNFHLNIPYETDLLIMVITFAVFSQAFQLPGFT